MTIISAETTKLTQEVNRLSDKHAIDDDLVRKLLCTRRIMSQIELVEGGNQNFLSTFFGMTPSLGFIPNSRMPGYDVDLTVNLKDPKQVYDYLNFVFGVDLGDGFTFQMRDTSGNDRISVGENRGIAGLPAVFQEVVVFYNEVEQVVIKLDAATADWPLTLPPFEVAPYFRSALGYCSWPVRVQSPEDAIGQKIQGFTGVRIDNHAGASNVISGDRVKDFGDLAVIALALGVNGSLYMEYVVAATRASYGVRGLKPPRTLQGLISSPILDSCREFFNQHAPPGMSFQQALRLVENFVNPVLACVYAQGTGARFVWTEQGWRGTPVAPRKLSESLPSRIAPNGFLEQGKPGNPYSHPRLPVVQSPSVQNEASAYQAR